MGTRAVSRFGTTVARVRPPEILVRRQRAARVVDDDAGRVEGARGADQGVGVAGGDEAVLVEDAPEDDGGMVAVALDHPGDLAPAVVEQSRRVADPAEARLGVDQHAVLVGQVEVAGNRRPDVDADQVEPGLLHQEDLPLQQAGVGGGDQTGRVVRLQEHAAQVERLAVEEELAVAHGEIAHAEGGVNLVDVLAAVRQDAPARGRGSARRRTRRAAAEWAGRRDNWSHRAARRSTPAIRRPFRPAGR